MAEKDYAAIVRKVHANNNLAKMGIFFPRLVEDDIWVNHHFLFSYLIFLKIININILNVLNFY